MRRKWELDEERYFGIGIYQPKTEENIGSLWRSALVLGADYIFIIGAKYKKQKTDVFKTWAKIPLFQYEDFDSFYKGLPYSCLLIGIEQDKRSTPIKHFKHPQRAIYLLGSENQGLPKSIKDKCHHLVELPGKESLNVSIAGSLVVFDRINTQ